MGINANGQVETVKNLIRLLHDAGWDAVKFQKRAVGHPQGFYSEEFLRQPRESPWGHTQRDQKEGLEFDRDEYLDIAQYCKELRMTWYASPWDVPSVQFLEDLNVTCYKVSSFTATAEKNVVSAIGETGKPVVLSTAFQTYGQIARLIRETGLNMGKLVLLHCIGRYPCPEDRTNFGKMRLLQKYQHIPVGYSGHEEDIHPTLFALGMGACMIERHVTLDRTMYGSDQAASLEPDKFEVIRKWREVAYEAHSSVASSVPDEEEMIVYRKLLDQSNLREKIT